MSAVRTAAETVALRDIGAALRGLWQLCRGEVEEDCLVRALTMNLIAAGPVSEAGALRAMVDRILRRLPCRAFLVLLEPDASRRDAQVSGAAQSTGRTREIVLEQIELPASVDALDLVAGVIRPLLVGDIPTHLFWADRLPDPPADLTPLLGLCDNVVVDSARFADPAQDLAALRGLRHEEGPSADLLWLRLRPWRRALAQAFEHFTWRTQVPTTVAVRHGPGPGAEAAGLLLGDWLRQRLQAEVTTGATGTGGPAALAQVELTHGDVHVRVDAVEAQLRVAITLADSCLLPFFVPASRGGTADLLAAAVDMA